MLRVVFILILSATMLPVQAQHEVGIKPMGGFLIAHHNTMRYLVETHTAALEVYYEKPVNGNKYWHNLYRKPEIGYMFFLGSPGNRQLMGMAYALVPYIKFHPVQKEVFHFNIKSGMGVGYLTQRFNRIDNNKNVAIGSHVNIVFNMSFEPEWTIKNWDLGAGISFIHYSNGAWKVPNLGFNIPLLHLNVGYRLRQPAQAIPTYDVKPTDKSPWKKWTFQLAFAGGIKEVLPVGGPKYGVYCLSATALVHTTPMSSFLFSNETYMNGAYHASLERFYKKEVNKGEAVRNGFAVGYGLNIGRLLLYLQNGVYVYSAYRDYDGSYFHRLGARYVLDNGFTLHGGLKTHFAKADNFEFGMGYTWGKAKNQ